MNLLTIHLTISGKVQGVFYRATAKKVAEELMLKGWIRNIPDNKVEAVISGEDSGVYQFIKWCNEGPGGATVEDVAISDHPETLFTEFKIIR